MSTAICGHSRSPSSRMDPLALCWWAPCFLTQITYTAAYLLRINPSFSVGTL
jgi:hypothetical protein